MNRHKNDIAHCIDCNRPAVFVVSVPWTSRKGAKGADRTPMCRGHYPTAERWETTTLPGHNTFRNAKFLLALKKEDSAAEDIM